MLTSSLLISAFLHYIATFKYSTLHSDIIHHIGLSVGSTYILSKSLDRLDNPSKNDVINLRRLGDWTLAWVTTSTYMLLKKKKVEKAFIFHHAAVIILNRIGYYIKDYELHIGAIGIMEWSSIVLTYSDIFYKGIKKSPLKLQISFFSLFMTSRMLVYYCYFFPSLIRKLLNDLSKDQNIFQKFLMGLMLTNSVILLYLNLGWAKKLIRNITI